MFGVGVAVAVALVASGCLSFNKFFISFIIIFSCKLHGITMTCYIVNRKADDFRTSSFIVTVAAFVSLCSCAWVVCSVCVLCGSSAVCALFTPSASASVVLCLCWVVRCSVCICYLCAWVVYSVCILCASSAPSASASASAMLCRPLLRLRLPLLCLCLVRVFCGSFAVCVPGSSDPSAFSVPCPLCLRLRLRLLCYTCVFFLLCQRC